MRLIEELKKENKLLNEELAQANETIQFLSQLNPSTVQSNLKNVRMPGNPNNDDDGMHSIDGEPGQPKKS